MSSSHSRNPLYPEVILSNPDAPSASAAATTSTSSVYPSIDTQDLENLFPESESNHHAAPPREQIELQIPGAIVNLIERDNSVELAYGDLSIVTLIQGDNVVAVFARVGDEIQWPLAKDEPVVKLDASHYFFTLRVPAEEGKGAEEFLNYGLTIAARGQEAVLKEFDRVLEIYSCFSVQKVKEIGNLGVLDARNVAPEEMEKKEKMAEMVESSTAYWTTLAPNVEDYSGSVARAIAAGSGQLIRGILWCGDVTVDRLKWGNDFLSKRLKSGSNAEVSPAAKRRIQRVKRLTKMSEKVATGILSGVVKVSGFFTGSIVNSKAGKKFFSLLPGEIVLASLDGFNKVCDAVEVAGKNVMNTTSVVTTGLVSQKYGEEAGKATNDGLGAAGHAIGTAWAVFKIRKALNPKSVMSPTALAKAASQTKAEVKAAEKKSK